MPATPFSSPTPPLAPGVGDLWFDSANGREYYWYISPSTALGSWVQTQPPSTATPSPTPPVAPVQDQLWLNTNNGREYVWYINPSGHGQWVDTQPDVAMTLSPTAPTPHAPTPVVTPHDVHRTPTITVSAVQPVTPLPGDLWWDTMIGEEFIFYDDGNTTQWVISNKGEQGPQGIQGPPGTTNWSDLVGVPPTFPPSPHHHIQDDITDLPHITVSTVPPVSPDVNDIWIDTN